MHDLVIENARLCDGLGTPAFAGALAVEDGRIAAIGIIADCGRPGEVLRDFDAWGAPRRP